MNSTNRFYFIHSPPPPPTKFIVTVFLLIKNLIFLYHIILSENFQSCCNGKPKNQLVLTIISMQVDVYMQLKWLNFNFTKQGDLNSYYLFVDLSASINGSESSDVTAAGANCGEYLKLAKKGGGHDGEIKLWFCHIPVQPS